MISDQLAAQLAMSGKWPLAWDTAPPEMTPEQARVHIAVCASRDRKMQEALGVLAANASRKAVRSAVRRYLSSSSARVHALAAAFRRKHGPLAKLTDKDIVAIPIVAAATSAWKGGANRPVAIPRLKRDGQSYRYIVKSDVFQYADQLLTASVVKAITKPWPTQFMSKNGGGIPGFEKWLRETLPDTKLILTIDVPRCYALMKHSSVDDALPLPGKVKSEVLFKPHARTRFFKQGPVGLIRDTAHNAQASSSNCGIAEGSALSSVVAELVLASVLRDLANIGAAVHAASHGDNLIVLMSDAALEEHVRHVLITSICTHFDVTSDELAGRITSASTAKRFVFCRRSYLWINGKLRTHPVDEQVSDYVSRMLVDIQNALATKVPAERNRQVAKLKRSLLGWLNQHHGPVAPMIQVLELWPLVPKEINPS